ncbi:hypothetical protein K493DRAFT_315451 [Basidiobolus meristosporus CBS 931.73]|uniref:Uncharacterized protein n=1 Tax=Basidiobolus meristosporus CBS 931.73 TaxID=1314790 RepID=A0A1Y1Y9V9_9FUNG|nr:hypothetical protein K493DRAFT_315451 [Basidiobolus meristosporus CBS 931.73]|eukprot:ORX94536.1 hypothetical protein K493DRAFT_315451 [Basidiobolus meristosporus CBS 931.73]
MHPLILIVLVIIFVGILGKLFACIRTRSRTEDEEETIPYSRPPVSLARRNPEMATSPPPYAEAITIPPTAYFTPTNDSPYGHSHPQSQADPDSH